MCGEFEYEERAAQRAGKLKRVVSNKVSDVPLVNSLVPAIRCYRCEKIGHIAKNCTSEW